MRGNKPQWQAYAVAYVVAYAVAYAIAYAVVSHSGELTLYDAYSSQS